MSWDIVLFNSSQKINSVEELDDAQLMPTNFCLILENHFGQIIKSDNHREIVGDDFQIGYFVDEEEVSNKILSLYGENALYELVLLAKKSHWQIFDTFLGQMIDLNNPANNGYENFRNYLIKVLGENIEKVEAENNYTKNTYEEWLKSKAPKN